MIKTYQRTFNQLHIILDGVLIALAFVVSYYLRFYSPLRRIWFLRVEVGTFYPLSIYARILILLLPGYLILYYLCNLYGPKRAMRGTSIFFDLIKANLLGILYFTFLLYFSHEHNFSRKFMLIFFVVNTLFGFLFRVILLQVLRIYRAKGFNLKHVLIVGYSRAATAYIDRIVGHPSWGYQIHGILDDNTPKGTTYKNVSVLGTVENLEKILPENKLDEIIIALGLPEYAKLEHIVYLCEKSGVHTKFIPDYNNIIPTIPYMEDLEGLPVINIRHVPLTNTANRMVKRAMDIVGSLFGILLFGIPMLIVAAAVKLTSPGPVIYSQVRVGLHNREFKMYKFRSMRVQEDGKDKSTWTTSHDDRVTPVGKFIRHTSLDEMPQFFNVLKGDMSLVGPRPERPFFVEKFREEIPRYMIKHQVKPGITGWAQVNGFRGDTSIRKRIEYDLYYIENWSVGLDIKILFLTIFKGFINKNAY